MKTPADYERMRQAKADKVLSGTPISLAKALWVLSERSSSILSLNFFTKTSNRVLTLHSHECTMCLTC